MKVNNKNYINNDWVDALDGGTFEVENPYTEEIIAEVPYSQEKDVDRAVLAAKEAWKDWKILCARLKKIDIDFLVKPKVRFKNKNGEQGTLFLKDPSGKVLADWTKNK